MRPKATAHYFDWRDLLLSEVAEQGCTVKGSTASPIANPLIKRIEAANTELRLLEGRLGLDPSARSALDVAAVRRVSKLDEMMRRQRES